MLDAGDGQTVGVVGVVRDLLRDDASPEGEKTSLAGALHRATEHLLQLQRDDGHWCAELEGDSILESEYAMLLWILGREDDPRLEQLCRTLRNKQLPSGGWAIHPDGPADPSASVKAYFVLKLQGDGPEEAHMQRAARVIRECGGIAKTNSFTKIYLAVFGVWPWSKAPAVPPELILAPRWFPLNAAEMSAWSRAIVIPLAMIWAMKPHCDVPVDLEELITGGSATNRGDSLRERFWFAFFRGVDRAVKVAEWCGAFRPVRRRSLDACERWTLERLPKSAGLAAIFPAIANAAVALHQRGFDQTQGPLADQLQELERLELLTDGADGPQLRLQPCCSPVWDTSLALAALYEAGCSPADPRLRHASTWLLEHEVRTHGDWCDKAAGDAPGGWYFEYANEFYPDCDDTAEVIAVLHHAAGSPHLHAVGEGANEVALDFDGAINRGVDWLLAMQNRDGGWGAFDRGCDRELFTFVPFADHNAMIDPSTVDVSSRAIEAIAMVRGADHAAVQQGADFVERLQEADGSWYGRWGCNYIYGTWLALCALRTVGRGCGDAAERGADWLLRAQLDDGGWGETLETYAQPTLKGRGPATAAQTAWALMGLMSARQARREDPQFRERVDGSLQRGVDFLLETQEQDGGWRDLQWTGTGFPQVFYLRYHYYDRYFPLQALAQYARLHERG